MSCKNGHWAKRNDFGHCVECLREAYVRWLKRHPEKRELRAASAREWDKSNPERVRENTKKWIKKNPEKVRTIRRRVQAARRASTPKWVDKESLKTIYDNCPIGLEVDHIIPIKGKTVCGLHVPLNLQYLTPEENKRKGNSFVDTDCSAGSPVSTAPANSNRAYQKPQHDNRDPICTMAHSRESLLAHQTGTHNLRNQQENVLK